MRDGQLKFELWQTQISHAVKVDGHWPGAAIDAEKNIDRAICNAVSILTARNGGLVEVIGITTTPIDMGGILYVAVTVLAKPMDPEKEADLRRKATDG